jgi:hypothetical protein
MTTPPIKNPVSQKDLKQAIADAKTYIQKLGKILRRDVTSKSNDHKNPSIKNEPFCDAAKPRLSWADRSPPDKSYLEG